MRHQPSAIVSGLKLTLAAVVGFLAACTSEPEVRVTETPVDASRATRVASTLGRSVAQSTADGASGADALSELLAATLDAQGLLFTGVTVKASSQTLAALGPCACTASECTFEQCAPSGTSGVHVNGRFTFGPDGLRCAGVRYDMAVSGVQTSLSLDCSVTVQDAVATGVFTLSGSLLLDEVVSGPDVSIAPITWTSSVNLLGVRVADRGSVTGPATVRAETVIGTDHYVGHAEIVLR